MKLPFSVVMDVVANDNSVTGFYGVPRDTFILIDLKTMERVGRISDGVKDALAHLEEVLGMP